MGMPGRLLQHFSFRCPHQFSWPRQSPDGSCYQICLRCGARYAYDWNTMRRVAPLEERAIDRPVKVPPSSITRGHRWRPRERRLQFDIPVEFRPGTGTEWLNGRTLNLNRSGLLLRAEQFLEPDTKVEFVLDMPAEIAGYNGSRVLGRGLVARAEKDKSSQAGCWRLP